MNKFAFTLTIALCFTVCCVNAQLRTSSVQVEQWLKNNFSGQGVVIGNIKYSGNPQAFSTFTSTPNILQVKQGLIISTGNAAGVATANNAFNYTKAFGDMKSPEKDKELAQIIKQDLYDISFIEFDFVPMANSIRFSYQFGSEEYPEYVGSAYNDIFAFFISDDTSTKNIALIPGKNVPVSVNTINFKSEPEHFIDNNVFAQMVINREAAQPKPVKRYRTLPGRILYAIKNVFTYAPPQDNTTLVRIQADPALMRNISPDLYRNLQYDGITKKLDAQAYVQPYKKYHLKIAVADVSDNVYDSGVFIENQSFVAKRDERQPGFVDYPDFSKYIDPTQILAGKKLEDLLPATITPDNAVIYFDFDKSEIAGTEKEKLRRIAEVVSRLGTKYQLQLTGHTDSIGNLDYNMALSQRRNKAVIDSLNKIISLPVQYKATEKAFLNPAQTNTTDDGRMKNRRVEVTFVRKENE
jgi:outer membrane protein OmpA-like peptidoglycan-associated protein